MIDEQRLKFLYFNEKYSAKDIAVNFDLSLSLVYRLMIKYNINRRTGQEQQKILFSKKPLSYCYQKPLNPNQSNLNIATLMLYSGEGAKTGKNVDFINSDPLLHQVFIKYLRTICNVDENRIRLYLYCYSNQNLKKLISFWIEKLNILKGNFTKPYIKISKPNISRTTPYGVIHLRYSDKKLLDEILLNIQDLNKQLLKT